ncbi:DNA glycosylase, partial [Elsinoe ampelina]
MEGSQANRTPKKSPKKRKRTSTTSDHFKSPTSTKRKKQKTGTTGRVPAGQSAVIFPPTTADSFGIVQERLWQDPFSLLIAVLFLNKTAGKSSMPVYREVIKKYPTPEALSKANWDELFGMVKRLGLQTQRTNKLIKLANHWVDKPPEVGVRYRTLHYPAQGDGKQWKPSHVEGDAEDCAGALEIGKLPGCGRYARDSWRIFCRDVLRGVASDYNGKDAVEGFEPEWKRVLPEDKELRAFLRWMWLKEGFVWDEMTGEKHAAGPDLLEKARLG